MNPKAFWYYLGILKMKLLKEKNYIDNGGILMFPMPYPHIIDKKGENFNSLDVY